MSVRAQVVSIVALALLAGCECGRRIPPDDGGRRVDAWEAPDAPGLDTALADTPPIDAPVPDAPIVIDPDAACGAANVEVEVERLPVDIVWMIDNSTSMAPAIAEVQAGMNTFATTLLDSGLDYRLILLSLRGAGMITVGGSNRYGVCIPEPLAGPSCADGSRFFQVEVDVRSTQPVEQLLGTLAQTAGYVEGDTSGRGSAPWRPLLRPGASRTVVVVTDDNSRTCDRGAGATCATGEPPLTVTSLLDFPGGPNPFNSYRLGPGFLDASYGGLFDGMVFDAVYGWGSDTDPNARCTYPGGTTMAASAGQTYTALVAATGGVRARICDGASAWAPFFSAVATGVVRSSRIACDVALPPPPDGMSLDTRLVNVSVRGASTSTPLPYVGSAGACDARGGWYYDSTTAPTRVLLCPASCDFARTETTGGGGLDVLFGCESIVF
jgi:hypothetical protein